MLVRQIFDPKLAQYAYLIGCARTKEAAIIDPERDIDRYMALAKQHGLRIVAALETHIHADYLSGLREFAEQSVKVYASDEGTADWKYEWLYGSDYDHQLLRDGDTFKVGNIQFTALHTPGHTPEHMVFMIQDGGSGAEDPIAMASGDFVFVGDVGRPDLLETAAGVEGAMEDGAKILYNSVQRFKTMPPFMQVWPGHGAGSACGKALGDIPQSTVGYELRTNPSVLAATSETNFVQYILDGQPEPPLYFARMKRDNRQGPKVLGSLPHPQQLTADDLATLAGRTDVAVVDTRHKNIYMDGHLPGSLLASLNKTFNTIVGSYVNEETPIYLIIDEARVEEAVRDLVRIGLDDIVGYATPETLATYASNGGTWSRIETIDFAEMEARRHTPETAVLDVRRAVEFASRHVEGAQNIAHTRLAGRLAEVPTDATVLVHCAAGARAAVAAALLARHGLDVVYVDDKFANYRPQPVAALANN